MKRNYFLLVLLSVFLFFKTTKAEELILKGFAANQKIKGADLIRYTDHSAVPNYVHFMTSNALTLNDLQIWMQTNFKLTNDYGMKLLNTQEDKIGFTHYRFQQTFKGIAVAASMYIVHVRNGVVESMGGEIYNNINATNSTSISEANALQMALNKINASVYKWQIAKEEKQLKIITKNQSATYFPKGDLTILKTKNGYQLCYAFNIYAAEPMSRTMQYVDVTNGAILVSHNLIETVGTTGIAHTKYSGIRTIKTDSVAPTTFHLQETTRGLGIATLNLQNGNSTGAGNGVDFVDNNDNWNNINAAGDEAATDAHWGAEMTYDFYSIKHGRNSIDNAGLALNSYMHYQTNFVNAFWDGTEMTYGDGNVSQGFLMMTGLDVCGHEITHGLTSYTAQLGQGGTGTNECDALNEGFSDIFGTCIERFARPTQWDWIMGADITCTTSGTPDHKGLRTLSNPALSGAGSVNGTQAQPVCYQGANWDSQGEPHNNNGPLIYWFYLLSTGNSASNIAALGVDTASEIAYRTLTVHLTSTATYADARFYSILSSTELYGGCSTPTIATTNAWNKVCVGAAYVASPTTASFTVDASQTCNTSLTVNFTNTSINGNKFTWNFGDATTSNAFNPASHNYSTGIYTVKLVADGGTCGRDSTTTLIKVGPPAGPATTGSTACASSSFTINATPNNVGDSINWYAAANGGTSLFTGNSYNTPTISSTTTYYAEEKIAGAVYHVGATNDNIGTNSNPNANHYLVFNCTAPILLQSVYVYSQSAGNRTIELRDSNGTVLQSTVINIPNSSTRITLNFSLPAERNLQLGISTSTTNVNFIRNNSGGNYPYTNGPVSITGNDIANGAYYYYFYDWILKGDDCYSLRTPTVVAINSSGKSPAYITNLPSTLNTCSPNTITLNANTGSGLTYQWFNAGAPINTATNSSYTTSASGNYSVSVNAPGCSSADTSAIDTVNVFTPPTVLATAAGNTTFCQGGSVTINASGANTYSWSNSQKGNSISVNQSGNYTVTGTDNNGCTGVSSAVAVTVNPNPVIIITPSSSTTFCQGGSVTLTASGSNSGNYTWSNSQTTNPITVNQSGNFTVSSINSNNCTGTSANTTVIVNPLPVVNIGVVSNTNGIVQFGNSTTGATSYSWNFGDGGSDNTATPTYQYTSSGTYHVVLTATSADGCIDSSAAMPVIIIISGIDDVSLLNGLKYFPNPFHQQFELQFAKQPFSGTLQVMNMLGQIIYQQDLENKSSLIIPTIDWADGNYLLHLKNNSVNSNIKIVKQ